MNSSLGHTHRASLVSDSLIRGRTARTLRAHPPEIKAPAGQLGRMIDARAHRAFSWLAARGAAFAWTSPDAAGLAFTLSELCKRLGFFAATKPCNRGGALGLRYWFPPVSGSMQTPIQRTTATPSFPTRANVATCLEPSVLPRSGIVTCRSWISGNPRGQSGPTTLPKSPQPEVTRHSRIFDRNPRVRG